MAGWFNWGTRGKPLGLNWGGKNMQKVWVVPPFHEASGIFEGLVRDPQKTLKNPSGDCGDCYWAGGQANI